MARIIGSRTARAVWVLLSATLALGSCASVFNHSVRDVQITPELKGEIGGAAQVASVRVLVTSHLGTYQATLPTRLHVLPDAWSRVRVKVVEPCYKPTEITLPRSITPWVWGDLLGVAVTAGAGAIFAFTGDGVSGTFWSYDRDAKVPVEPVENFSECLEQSRRRPGEPFVASRDPRWQDPRIYPIAAQGGNPTTYPTQK
jgi:hypothetical protein